METQKKSSEAVFSDLGDGEPFDRGHDGHSETWNSEGACEPLVPQADQEEHLVKHLPLSLPFHAIEGRLTFSLTGMSGV